MVSNTIQYDLTSMARIPYDDCILISDIKRDSVQFGMWYYYNLRIHRIHHIHSSEKTGLQESKKAMREVNEEMMRYFTRPQLLVFRSAILLAFVGPHLRGKLVIFNYLLSCNLFSSRIYFNFVFAEAAILMSLPLVCCYGPNNCGKSDRLLVYSACCGVLGGKNKSKS